MLCNSGAPNVKQLEANVMRPQEGSWYKEQPSTPQGPAVSSAQRQVSPPTSVYSNGSKLWKRPQCQETATALAG